MSDYFKYFPTINYENRRGVNLTKRMKILENLQEDPYAFLPYTIRDEDRPEDIAQYYYDDVNKVWLIYLANEIVDPYTQWPMTSSTLEQVLRNRYELEFTFDHLSVDSFTVWGEHPFLETDPVIYQADVTLSGLTALQTYYVVDRTPTSFRLSLTPGGIPINITAAGELHKLTRNLDVFLLSQNLECNVAYYINQDGFKIAQATYRLDSSLVKSEWTKVTVYEEAFERNESKRTIWLVNNLYADRLQAQLETLYES